MSSIEAKGYLPVQSPQRGQIAMIQAFLPKRTGTPERVQQKKLLYLSRKPKPTTMVNPYYQMSMQLVLAVKYRDAMIKDSFKDQLHKYIGGILVKQKHKPLAINSMPDHIHIFFGMHPCDIPSLVRDIKSDSSTFINTKKLSKHKFHWQEGYGLFSYSMSHRSVVINYIENQQEHHKKLTFREEYLNYLKKFEVDYDLKYLFEFFD